MITGTSDFVLPTNTGYWYFAGTDGSAVTQPDGSIRYSPGASGYATAFVTESGRILTGIPYCACYTSVEAFPSSLLQDCARIKKPNMFEAIKEECMDTPTTSLPPEPTVPAPVPTSAPGSLTTKCCELDAAGNPFGVFNGIVDQSDSGQHRILIDYSPDGIVTTYPLSACGNTVPYQPEVVSKGRLEWTEVITYGVDSCISGGSVSLAFDSGNEWDFLWTHSVVATRVVGTLTSNCKQTDCPMSTTVPAPPITTAAPAPTTSGTFVETGTSSGGESFLSMSVIRRLILSVSGGLLVYLFRH